MTRRGSAALLAAAYLAAVGLCAVAAADNKTKAPVSEGLLTATRGESLSRFPRRRDPFVLQAGRGTVGVRLVDELREFKPTRLASGGPALARLVNRLPSRAAQSANDMSSLHLKPPTRGTVTGPVSRTVAARSSMTSPYWRLERKYVQQQHQLGAANAELRQLRRQAATRRLEVHRSTVATIRLVFGPAQGDNAVKVATCESHLDPGARNGQFRGILQMGEHERATYGDGPTVLEQALAAYRYFLVSGWTPWRASYSCHHVG